MFAKDQELQESGGAAEGSSLATSSSKNGDKTLRSTPVRTPGKAMVVPPGMDFGHNFSGSIRD